MKQRSLCEVLQSTSDCLFPADMGERIVSIDSTDCDGDTPLHVLIWRGDKEGALLLIQHGADVNAAGDMGETPLHIAISKKNLPLIEAMIKAGARLDIVSEFGQTARSRAKELGINLKQMVR